MSNPALSDEPIAPLLKPNIVDCLWQPLHAKLWWSATTLYWSGMFASMHVDLISGFYRSAVTGFANVLFFPPLMVLVLLFGYIKAGLNKVDFDAAPDNRTGLDWQDDWYGPSGMLREFDPLDPASGALWVGNPLNPLNGAYINRHPS